MFSIVQAVIVVLVVVVHMVIVVVVAGSVVVALALFARGTVVLGVLSGISFIVLIAMIGHCRCFLVNCF